MIAVVIREPAFREGEGGGRRFIHVVGQMGKGRR